MENSISTTYNIVGMNLEHCATTVEDNLSATAGVISVKINLEKKEAIIISKAEVEIANLEQALAETDYYITKQTENNWVAAPSLRNTSKKHSASRDIEGSSGTRTKSGPATDYEST